MTFGIAAYLPTQTFTYMFHTGLYNTKLSMRVSNLISGIDMPVCGIYTVKLDVINPGQFNSLRWGICRMNLQMKN